MKLWYSLPILTSMALIGCGNNNTTTTSEPNTTSSTKDSSTNTSSAEEQAQAYVSPLPADAPTYKMATVEYPPFAFRDEYGQPMGYDIDLIRAIGEEAGFKVEVSQLLFSDLLQSVQDGKNDFAMSGLSLIPERQEVMLSSMPYSKGKAGFLVASYSTNTTIEELQEKRISVVEKTSLHGIMEKAGVENLVLEPSLFLSFQAVFTKKADAVFGMQPMLIYSSNQFKENPVKFIPYSEPILTTVYAGLDKQEFIDKVNEGLKKVQENGKYQQISTKWFGVQATEITLN